MHEIQDGGQLSLFWSTADREGELDSKSQTDDHVFRDFDLLIRSQSFTISQHQSRILMMMTKMIMSRGKTRIDDDDACNSNSKSCNINLFKGDSRQHGALQGLGVLLYNLSDEKGSLKRCLFP